MEDGTYRCERCGREWHTPWKVAEEMFGKMRHSTKEEADAYEAMLKSMSVELHPVDRDALLALADEMERMQHDAATAATDGVVDAWCLREYARCIREALGVRAVEADRPDDTARPLPVARA